jgi:phage repressor protein C with HTH and peptisase S24 domain
LVSPGREAREGDIVLVETRSHGRYIHRVVEVVEDGTYRLRGDANDTADLTPVGRTEVDGVVVRVLPAGAWLDRWKRV